MSVKGSRNSGVQTMARGTNAAHHPGPLLTVLYLVLPAKTLDTPGLVQSGALMFCIMQNVARNIQLPFGKEMIGMEKRLQPIVQ